MSDKKERDKVCPYNEFAPCYQDGCPAFQDLKCYKYFCKFVEDELSPVRY